MLEIYFSLETACLLVAVGGVWLTVFGIDRRAKGPIVGGIGIVLVGLAALVNLLMH